MPLGAELPQGFRFAVCTPSGPGSAHVVPGCQQHTTSLFLVHGGRGEPMESYAALVHLLSKIKDRCKTAPNKLPFCAAVGLSGSHGALFAMISELEEGGPH